MERDFVTYMLPNKCYGCRLCLECSFSSKPHLHREKQYRTGGGFTYSKKQETFSLGKFSGLPGMNFLDKLVNTNDKVIPLPGWIIKHMNSFMTEGVQPMSESESDDENLPLSPPNSEISPYESFDEEWDNVSSTGERIKIDEPTEAKYDNTNHTNTTHFPQIHLNSLAFPEHLTVKMARNDFSGDVICKMNHTKTKEIHDFNTQRSSGKQFQDSNAAGTFYNSHPYLDKDDDQNADQLEQTLKSTDKEYEGKVSIYFGATQNTEEYRNKLMADIHQTYSTKLETKEEHDHANRRLRRFRERKPNKLVGKRQLGYRLQNRRQNLMNSLEPRRRSLESISDSKHSLRTENNSKHSPILSLYGKNLIDTTNRNGLSSSHSLKAEDEYERNVQNSGFISKSNAYNSFLIRNRLQKLSECIEDQEVKVFIPHSPHVSQPESLDGIVSN